VGEAELGRGREPARGLSLMSGEVEKLPEGWTRGRQGRDVAPEAPSARLVVLGIPSEGVRRHARTVVHA
jgi:hypothetical protein